MTVLFTIVDTRHHAIVTDVGQFGLKTSMLQVSQEFSSFVGVPQCAVCLMIYFIQDFEAGRELETATIVHALVELAEAVDVDTPRLRTVQALLTAIDKPSKLQSIDRHKDLQGRKAIS